MAVGDKKPVVMEEDMAVPGGIATLGTDGKLASEQIPGLEALGVIEYINSLPFTRKNLLDNWYFADPIDQRGGWVVPPGAKYRTVDTEGIVKGETNTYWKVEYIDSYDNAHILVNGVNYWVDHYETPPVPGYVTSFDHAIDRWLNGRSGSVVLIGDSYIEINESGDLFQRVDMNLSGKTVTASILTDTGLKWGTKAVPQTEGEFVTAFEDDTVALLLGCFKDSGMTQFSVMSNNSIEHKLFAAKLEIGDTQTLAHQDENGNWVLNDPPPNKQQELAKCQRYYINLGGSLEMVVPGANLGDIQTAIFDIPVPVTMRATPKITDVHDFGMCLVNGTWHPITNMDVDAAHAGSVRVFWGDNGLTDTVPCVIDGAKFSLSADL